MRASKPAVLAAGHLALCSYSQQKMALFFSLFHTSERSVPCSNRRLLCILLQECVSLLPTLQCSRWIKRRVLSSNVLFMFLLLRRFSALTCPRHLFWSSSYHQLSNLCPYSKQCIHPGSHSKYYRTHYHIYIYIYMWFYVQILYMLSYIEMF